MNRFYLDNTSYSISIERFYTKYMNQEMFKMTLYNSILEIDSIIFNGVYELCKFMMNLKFYIEFDTIEECLYNSPINNEGISYQICIVYKYMSDNPTEEDDILLLDILKSNSNKSECILHIESNEVIFDDLIMYIVDVIKSYGYNLSAIIKEIL